jgi:hypothetical protein
MDIETRKKMEELLNKQEKLINHLKENKMIQLEISYLFENLGDQLGLVTFYVPEELGYKLSSILNPEYKPYKIYIRVIENQIKFIDLEGGDICFAYNKRDSKMIKFEEELKSLPLGITFKTLPM